MGPQPVGGTVHHVLYHYREKAIGLRSSRRGTAKVKHSTVFVCRHNSTKTGIIREQSMNSPDFCGQEGLLMVK